MTENQFIRLGGELEKMIYLYTNRTPVFNSASRLTSYLKDRAKESNVNLVILSNERIFKVRRGFPRFQYDYGLYFF